MSVLDAFLTTWSQAHSSFGDGAPQTGDAFDHSTQLRRLRSDVEAAAPGAHWCGGTAADAYGVRNDRQARTLGGLADLDQRLGATINQSAAVVARGRRELDAVRQWVMAAVDALPGSATGEQLLIPVIGKGSGEIAAILSRSHTELAAIAEQVRALSTQYAALATEPPATRPEAADG